MATDDKLKAYKAKLKELDDDELIDAFHEAICGHEEADAGHKDEAYQRRLIAEQVMICRFGLGEHMKRYKARSP